MDATPGDLEQAAIEVLKQVKRLIAKFAVDCTGADPRPELQTIQDALERVGHPVSTAEEQTAYEMTLPPPRDRFVNLFDLAEAMLYGMAEPAGTDDELVFDGILSALRHGDLNALIRDDVALELLHEAIAAHVRDGRDIEQFLHFIMWLRRLKDTLADGPIPKGGTYDVTPEDAVPVDDDEEDDDDEDWGDLGEPG